jgi:hypothetical protein
LQKKAKIINSDDSTGPFELINPGHFCPLKKITNAVLKILRYYLNRWKVSQAEM